MGSLSMRFLALAVSHSTVPSSSRHRHTELTRRRSRSLEESRATIKRKKTWRSRKSLLRRSKLGESLMKMQQKTSLSTEATSSKIIEETTTSPPESAKIFGRKFSASLENFASLSLRDNRVEGDEVNNETETFRASNKRKREETPLQEVISRNRWPAERKQGSDWKMSPLTILQATWRTPPSSPSGCPAWRR